MSQTEAQKSAKKAYIERIKAAGAYKRVGLEFYPNEQDMYAYLVAQGQPIATTIKALIRKEMQEW